MSVIFRQYGSLYYSSDLDMAHQSNHLYTDNEGKGVQLPRFAVGPSCGREFFDDMRSEVEVDRGPCKRNIAQRSYN